MTMLQISLVLVLFQFWLISSQTSRDVDYFDALKLIDFAAVKEDILDMLFDSKDFYPADYGFYGPFMVRNAWHCSGTIRVTDGEGGCDGGRIIMEPERSWADNTNLDKAKILLEPIKLKYGLGLSWGDLIIYTGTVALEFMGVPTIGFCAGRVDAENGFESEIFGPGEKQEELTPCPVDGDCQSPFGAKLLEHIYVDPLGFKKDPDPVKSIPPMKEIFARMGMTETETLALIGGGHTFGKVHGGCSGSVGSPPKDDPENPWPFPNECGAKPSDKTTSGLEGPWSPRPIQFNNFFFNTLLNREWELQSSNGTHLFKLKNDPVFGPSADATFEQATNMENLTEEVIMLVTDITLVSDPSYRLIAESFADNFALFGQAFASAWYKITTRDMGPSTRCFGDLVPEPQSFQGPLPSPYEEFPSFQDLLSLLQKTFNDEPEERALIIEAAFLCASTFRVTDHFGGCNGGRIFQQPERGWPERVPVSGSLSKIETVLSDSPLEITKSDFLVFTASNILQSMIPVEYKEEVSFTFCPFRSDAPSEYQLVSDILKLQTYQNKIIQTKRHIRLLDISVVEYVALQGRPRSATYMNSLGYSGGYSENNAILSNTHAKTLLTNAWTRNGVTGILGDEFVNEDGDKFITFFDFLLTLDDEFSSALFFLAQDETVFIKTFQNAWTKIMNADRFDGPVENLCTNSKINIIDLNKGDAVVPDSSEEEGNFAGAGFIFLGICITAFLLALVVAKSVHGGNSHKHVVPTIPKDAPTRDATL